MRKYEVSYRAGVLIGTLVTLILSGFSWLLMMLHIIVLFFMIGNPIIPFTGGFITAILVRGKPSEGIKAGIVSSFLAVCILDAILLSLTIISHEKGFAAGLAGIAVFLIAISFLFFGLIGSFLGSLIKTFFLKHEAEQKLKELF